MLYAYNNNVQNVAVNGTLTFSGQTRTNCVVTSAAGTGSISLNEPGVYEVSFNADAANTTATAGNIQVRMSRNGVAVPGAVATENSTSTDDTVNLAFSAIIRVLPNCCAVDSNLPTVLTFQNTGIDANYTNAAVTVRHYCG